MPPHHNHHVMGGEETRAEEWGEEQRSVLQQSQALLRPALRFTSSISRPVSSSLLPSLSLSRSLSLSLAAFCVVDNTLEGETGEREAACYTMAACAPFFPPFLPSSLPSLPPSLPPFPPFLRCCWSVLLLCNLLPPPAGKQAAVYSVLESREG